jgi:hypothetical protein
MAISANAEQPALTRGNEPLSMTIAVSLLLRAYPSVSTGLTPSKGGSLTLHILAGTGLGELRPEGGGMSAVAEGAIAVKDSWLGKEAGGGRIISCRALLEWALLPR